MNSLCEIKSFIIDDESVSKGDNGFNYILNDSVFWKRIKSSNVLLFMRYVVFDGAYITLEKLHYIFGVIFVSYKMKRDLVPIIEVDLRKSRIFYFSQVWKEHILTTASSRLVYQLSSSHNFVYRIEIYATVGNWARYKIRLIHHCHRKTYVPSDIYNRNLVFVYCSCWFISSSSFHELYL